MKLRRYGWLPALVLLLVVYWFLPFEGQVVVLPGQDTALSGPHFTLDPPAPQPGDEVLVTVRDTVPWSFVQLTVDGEPAWPLEGEPAGEGIWSWEWLFDAPDEPGYEIVFYHDCHTGCVERGRIAVGRPLAPESAGLPTKLCVVFPNPERDWQGRSGWVVEVAYARQAEAVYWGVDDLAARVAKHTEKGLRVLVRVDYDEGQSLPPVGDYLALGEYLDYLQRLARDDRLQGVYGYVVGTGFNAESANALAPERPTTPAWYARLFNGYGEEVTHRDNAVQMVRAVNPEVRLIVGPVQAWNSDQEGERSYAIDVPWLNYMNTLVAYLDAAAQAKAAAGIPLAAPDGFDVQAVGHPDLPEMEGRPRAEEPTLDLAREAWDGAQAGFRIYEEWLAIINAYPTTRGLPVYIISTNTYDREADVPPAQNYPRGWLTNALAEINREPQIQALCWFLDAFPHDTQWDWFSLTEQPGRLVDAAEEFDALLRAAP
jgi:hypothetical protein